MTRCHLLLIDLDNTIYDWITFYAHSLRSMTQLLAAELDLGNTEIVEEFRAVYAHHGSLEYAFVVQELSVCQGLSAERISELINIAQEAYANARRTHLRAYPGVREALEVAKSSGMLVSGMSNAPAFQAQRRLRQLELLELFDGLAVWQGFNVDEGDVFYNASAGSHNTPSTGPMPALWEFGADALKPKPLMYSHVLETLEVRPEKALAVGDSIAKDLEPAAAVGISVAWAEYGTRVAKEDIQLLRDVTPWSAREVHAEDRDPPPSLRVLKSGWDLHRLLSDMGGTQAHRVGQATHGPLALWGGDEGCRR